MSEEKSSPPTFADSSGRTWTINLTLGLIDHIQEATGVDLLADGEHSPLTGLLFDPRKLARVLFASLGKQAESQRVDQKAFTGSLTGDSLAAGWGALVDAVVFFTPSQSRAALRAGIDAQMMAMEQGVLAIAKVASSTETNEAIRQRMKQLEEEMQAELPRALAGSATN